MNFRRSNNNFLFKWWVSLDQLTYITILIILFLSAVITASASPAVAERIGLDNFYFVRKQLVFLLIAFLLITAASFLSSKSIKLLGTLGFVTCLCLMLLVLYMGAEVKGARRWISIAGFSMQPSEFVKIFFSIVTAWILSEKEVLGDVRAYIFASFIYLLTVSLLLLQPDVGMTIVVSGIWGALMFLSGLPMILVFSVCIVGIFAMCAAYFVLPHVQQRINNFLEPNLEGNYQVKKSLEAYSSGGFFGKGPGEGTVKEILPDSHTDFVFAVIGEEFGIIFCIILLLMLSFIIVRSLLKIFAEQDLFAIYAVAGIILQFAFQTIINIGVTLNMLPTKGMTLPFISYGGSSMFAIAIAMGLVLALTKKRFGYVGFNIRKELDY